jgi:hypothetical protein
MFAEWDEQQCIKLLIHNALQVLCKKGMVPIPLSVKWNCPHYTFSASVPWKAWVCLGEVSFDCFFSSVAFKNGRIDAVGMTAGANILSEIPNAREN